MNLRPIIISDVRLAALAGPSLFYVTEQIPTASKFTYSQRKWISICIKMQFICYLLFA